MAHKQLKINYNTNYNVIDKRTYLSVYCLESNKFGSPLYVMHCGTQNLSKLNLSIKVEGVI